MCDQTEMNLDQMVQKAQQFEDFKSNESVKPKKLLRRADSSSEKSHLHKQIEELQKQIVCIQAGKKSSSHPKGKVSSAGTAEKEGIWPEIASLAR